MNQSPLHTLTNHELLLMITTNNINYTSAAHAPNNDVLHIQTALPYSTGNLPSLITKSIFQCEPEYISNIISNIVLVGGSSPVHSLADRLKFEIEKELYFHPIIGNTSVLLHNGTYRVRTHAIPTKESSISAWLGGSILGSLSSFHDVWISKAEYDERGSFIIDKKCP